MQPTKVEILPTVDGFLLNFEAERGTAQQSIKDVWSRRCSDLPDALRAVRQEFEPHRSKARSAGFKHKDTSQARVQR